MTCAHCEELEEEVAYLKSELGLQVNADALQRLISAMKSGQSHGRIGPARMILALYAANGRPMSRFQILDAVPARDDKDRDAKLADVWVWAARKAFGAGLIINVWGQGYQLSSEGMERVAYLIGDAHGKAPLTDIQELSDRESGELRSLAAHIAGVLAHRDGDGGVLVAETYRRIADRLSGRPRAAA